MRGLFAAWPAAHARASAPARRGALGGARIGRPLDGEYNAQGLLGRCAVDASTIIVGMSGGVDSAVAALLLKREGHAVAGVFMKNWDEDDGGEFCTAAADFEDARRVCDALDIELLQASFAAEYWDAVFEVFLAEHRAGRTPNPDVLCNSEIKFKLFLQYAQTLGADGIATGHYTRSRWVDGDFQLLKGADAGKDQSYFLHGVPAERLAPCRFPLGELTKPEVRRLAQEAGLTVHDKQDSTGICFIGERPFGAFLARYLPPAPGAIVATDGTVLGEHRGLAWYTLGQRQGLGIGGLAGRRAAPWYVVAKRPAQNELVVSQNEGDLLSQGLIAKGVNWLADVDLPLRCTAKTRYRQPDQACLATPAPDDGLRLDFDAPQRAVTPGQYACLYAGERCLGGGVIETAIGAQA